ncbi:hypothetical protein GCM10011344_20720 [Dokdonia pacifica]|nr:hypothetical protein GCM10011344_20720 [Dokdonia pacifica]
MAANFYQQTKLNFDELKKRIEATPFSRGIYKYAWYIKENPQFYSKIELAYAFYIGVTQGFNSNFGSWAVDNYGKSFTAFKNRKMKYNKEVLAKLDNAQLENMDAVKLLDSKKNLTDVFAYCDPPYIGTNCGMYGSYSEADYINLLEILAKMKGNFLLSSFPNTTLYTYIKKYGWQVQEFHKTKTAVKGKRGISRTAKKTELLVANYPI